MRPFNPQSMSNISGTTQVLRAPGETLITQWLAELARMRAEGGRRADEDEERAQASELVKLIREALEDGDTRLSSKGWAPVRRLLDTMSASRARQGFSATDTATFVMTLKRPLFDALRELYAQDAAGLARETWQATELIDALALHTTAAFQQAREDVIMRQQEDMLELSTPVVRLWDGILLLPMIGTLDSARTQVVMEALLQRIIETGAQIAILDITGVPTVDTLVAQHLLKTVTAIRLMGSDCIISGLRPQIAQTIVHLGVDLQGITTKASIADALALALQRTGQVVVKSPAMAAT